ncbi:hypothetical protein OG900_33440 [Streptomyces sp. NBC_00433]
MTPQNPAPVMGRRNTTPAMEEPMGIHPTPISVPPWTVLGYRADGRPILPIAGGAEDDDDVVVDDPEPEPEPDVDPEPEDDPEPEPDPAPKPKAPAKKAAPKPGDDDYVPSAAEWRRTQAALTKANADAKRNRERARELEDQGRVNESDHEKALRLAREEGEKRFRAPLVRTAARGALIEAGALSFLADEKDPESRDAKERGDSRLTRLLKLIDTDGLDVDESGAVAGLESAVDELRRDYPELFAAPKKRVAARPTGAPRPAADPVKKSSAQIHADKALGRS